MRALYVCHLSKSLSEIFIWFPPSAHLSSPAFAERKTRSIKVLRSSQSSFLREFASQKTDLAWIGGKSGENNVFVFAINNAKSDYWWFMELKKHFAAEFITKFNSASDASSAEVTVLYSIICLAMNWMFASLIIVFNPLLSSMVLWLPAAPNPTDNKS